VTSIAAIQYPLRYVHPRSGDVRFVVHIRHSIDWAAVNSHPQLNVRMILQRFANLECTSHRLFWTPKEE
jgi:hypothetical protein